MVLGTLGVQAIRIPLKTPLNQSAFSFSTGLLQNNPRSATSCGLWSPPSPLRLAAMRDPVRGTLSQEACWLIGASWGLSRYIRGYIWTVCGYIRGSGIRGPF